MCAVKQAYEGPGAPVRCGGYKGAHFTCFAITKVQTLTAEEVRVRRLGAAATSDFDSCAKLSNSSSDDPVLCRGHACVRFLLLSLLALPVQKYKY
jgi:hypothetical protein